MNRKRILIVDDEPGVLNAIERVIKMSIECETVIAGSGKEALDLLEKQPFDVIVSDIMMPGMNGIDLLNVVQELYPKTVRLAFSGWATEEVAFRTAGTVHQFFKKPGDIALVGAKIQGVLNLRRLLPEEGLERVVACVKTLPALPIVYLELEKELAKENPSVERVGEILEQDIAMSAKVLQLVNSAFFGLREHVGSPSQAAALLGLNIVRSLVLAFHVFGSWKDRRVSGFRPDALWEHSLSVGGLARSIAQAENLDAELREDAHIAGMFHDLGRLILADNIPDSCEAIEKLVAEKKIALLDAEREVLGATHAETGAYLLALWGFPDNVVNGVAFHHAPCQIPAKGVTPAIIVHVANALDHEKRGEAATTGQPLDEDCLEAQGVKDRLPRWRSLALASGT